MNFQNVEQWLKLMNDISKSVENGSWRTQKITIELNYENVRFKDYKIIYQNVIKMLRFLLDHKSFKDDLIYEFCRIFKLIKNDKEIKIYLKMYTIDWWWEIQNKFSKKATLMSFLIETDKTILIKHRDNIFAWSVYLIIKNLWRRVKHFKKRLNMILLDMISIIKSKNKFERKSRIWHFVMSTMLKRE